MWFDCTHAGELSTCVLWGTWGFIKCARCLLFILGCLVGCELDISSCSVWADAVPGDMILQRNRRYEMCDGADLRWNRVGVCVFSYEEGLHVYNI